MANLGAVSYNDLHFPRRDICLECPAYTVPPSCPPSCPSGQVCSLVPTSCEKCAHSICVTSSMGITTATPVAVSNGSGPNVGAIAGGVIGGVLAIAAVTYVVWRFCIKTRRQQYEQEDWIDDPNDSLEAEKEFTMRRDARASTHTVGSIASTVLTRASNIIQIAYIPGVTNRSAPSTPGLLVPPVPPIPIALSSTSSSPQFEHEHFFMPGDLRDSTYSGMSDRTSYARTDRTSYARTSVASTIYGKNAVVSPVPAQTVIRGKAAVVSVKSNGAGGGELTPPVPSVDYDKYLVGPPSPAFSVGSTFLNSATAATQVRPQVVRVPSGPKQSPPQILASDEDQSGQHLLSRDSNAITIIDDTPNIEQGVFSDPPRPSHQSNTSLSAVIEEATKKAQGSKERTPFGDEHELQELE